MKLTVKDICCFNFLSFYYLSKNFIKLILVVLALTGGATLWFIVLLDFAASIFGVLNVVRLPAADLQTDDADDN